MATEVTAPAVDVAAVRPPHASSKSRSGSKSTLQFLCDLSKHPRYCGLTSSSQMVDPKELNCGPIIGKGAYAVVTLCEKPDNVNHIYTRHAIKQLKPAVANDKVEMKFFLLEAHIISQLQHRNIIRFDGFGMRKPQEIRTAFYLMEHLPGGSLKGRFQPDQGSSVNRAQFSSMDALRWSIQLCSAIAHMHGLDAPIVHRDIKLENILLTTQSTASANVKLADFGLAVQLEHRQKYSQDDALQQLNEHLRTEASGPIGTSDLENWYHLTGQSGSLLYMAPEVFLNLPYNEKADVFSLGVVIYELFVGMQMADLVLKHRTWAEAKEFARTVARGHRVKLNTLPPDQASLIRACWQQPPNVSGERVQDPTRRPTSFEVLQALLEMEAQVNRGNPRAHGERATLADTRTGNASWVQRSISKIANALHRRLSI